MKLKNLILAVGIIFGMTTFTMGQNVPNYVPTNGLVGWWNFDTNVNDGSGNQNNGTLLGGATASGYLNLGYNTSDYLILPASTLNNLQSFSVSFKIKFNSLNLTGSSPTNHIISGDIPGYEENFGLAYQKSVNKWRFAFNTNLYDFSDADVQAGTWYCITLTRSSSGVISLLKDNVAFPNTYTNSQPVYVTSLLLGQETDCTGGCFSLNQCTNAQIDDLAIHNVGLSLLQVQNFCNPCNNNTTISPQVNNLTIGSTASFTATTNAVSPTFVWQSDFGQGFQTLNNFGNYTGVNTASLNIANVLLSNHNQPIRVITSSEFCTDTSNVALIVIEDTCLTTIIDTILVTVTDTLIIDTHLTGLIPPNNTNTIKIFPNPASDYITIDYGNFAIMNGYQLKIENSLGQLIFQTNITQQSDYLNLTNWGGNGLYYVQIIDPQGNIIDIRKIILQ